ncbi:hypothetical protein JZ751_011538 [Albula glossodonta]|uniref:Uncharacterized protein n=1 Tax=Albula glossodonta TaxID=121402 RepID=A0A8T2MYS5_9TELE|nr:hypothetical protein JZ751_011538 [Albula glossodonta]
MVTDCHGITEHQSRDRFLPNALSAFFSFEGGCLLFPIMADTPKHIIKIDGKAGLFSGLAPRLCAGTIGTIVHSTVLQRCQEEGKPELPGSCEKGEDGSLKHVVNETTKEMIARCCATVVTHPFHGNNTVAPPSPLSLSSLLLCPCGVFDSICTIYREEGILGFFAGMIPRLLGDVLSLWICNMLAHLINTYAIDDSVRIPSVMVVY